MAPMRWGGWRLVSSARSSGSSAPSDPWANLDGRLAAPSGTPQYPTYFTSLNGITPYPVRPPWKVAGVDYRVGINTGVSLKNPNTIPSADGVAGSSLGAGQNAQTLQVQRDATFDGYDFTLAGGWSIVTNGFNVTVSNSKLQNLCLFAASSTSIVTMLYNEIDGLGLSAETTFGAVVLLQTGVKMVAKYNWLKNAGADVIDLTTQDITAQYNLFDTMGWSVGAHADAIQFAGDGTANNILISFNTHVQSQLGTEGPSSFIDLEIQVSATAVMNNPVVAYNTASYTATGALQNITGAADNGSGLVRLAMASTTNISNGSFKQIASVGGVPGANGQFLVSVIDGTHVDLLSSTFSGAYTSGGTIRSLGSTFFRVSTGGGGMFNASVHDNYADQNAFMLGVISDSSPGTGYAKSGNILLNSGGTF